ncbi:MAG TPA: pitrilysin family protein [Vicinamibacteria bacterium]|jgi:predicted Zn-dependent peptidase
MSAFWLVPWLVASSPQTIPARPEELRFDELRFDVPDPARYRHELSNGVPVYVAPDSTFPLVHIGIQLRQGSYLEPENRVGLAGLTGSLLRTGGTSRLDPGAFDEEAEYLAAGISSFGGDSRAGASLDCISPVLDPAMDLFFEMLRRPRFDGTRLAVEKENLLEAMRQRNDDPADILAREWSWLLEGETFYRSRRMTKDRLDAITRDDLVSFHEKYWRPENMIVTVSGDVDPARILAKLESYLANWPGKGASTEWPPPQPTHEPRPGAYHVEKDIPQGTVVLGHSVPRWTDWGSPDRAALQVMDHILGGSGFTSRITKRIRSDEGLAYDASSSFDFDALGPGSFTVSFQSKNATVALASKIALEEIERIRSEPASEEEIALAKASLIETFPRRFESAAQIAGTYAGDAFIGRSHDYWKSWRAQVQAVAAADVLGVARKYLKPEAIVFLVVGKWEEIGKGDPEGRASMKELFGGKVTHLPLRDPLTLKVLP